MWDDNLDRMNESEKGKPSYSFPDSLINIIGHIRIYFHLPYRQTDGIIKATGKSLPKSSNKLFTYLQKSKQTEHRYQ